MIIIKNKLNLIFFIKSNKNRFFHVSSYFFRKNYYELLEIDPTSSQSDIKKAYFNKSKIYHPDINSKNLTIEENKKNFLKVQKAYETLSNLELKDNYDRRIFGTSFDGHNNYDKNSNNIFNQEKKFYKIKKKPVKRSSKNLNEIMLKSDVDIFSRQQGVRDYYENKEKIKFEEKKDFDQFFKLALIMFLAAFVIVFCL